MINPKLEQIKYDQYQLIPMTPITGWVCSVCYEPAQVMCAGETMCIEHAKRWNHGYGETIKELKEHQSDTD